jgi:hypothetical protein
MKKILCLVGLLNACMSDPWSDIEYSEENPIICSEDNMAAKIRDCWSQSGTLRATNPNRNVTLQANFPKSSVYTVQFLIQNTTIAAVISPTAEITWSVEGNQVKRIVSVTNGTCVTGVGQGVSVRLFDNAETGPGVIAQNYVGTIVVAPGTRAPTQQPPTYVPWIQSSDGFWRPGTAVINAASTLLIAVPTDAGVISMFTSAGGSAAPMVIAENNLSVTQNGNAGVALKRYDPRIADWVPVSPQTISITFNNAFAGPGNRLMFSLAFGIDG